MEAIFSIPLWLNECGQVHSTATVCWIFRTPSYTFTLLLFNSYPGYSATNFPHSSCCSPNYLILCFPCFYSTGPSSRLRWRWQTRIFEPASCCMLIILTSHTWQLLTRSIAGNDRPRDTGDYMDIPTKSLPTYSQTHQCPLDLFSNSSRCRWSRFQS